jgi:hypothetical protein
MKFRSLAFPHLISILALSFSLYSYFLPIVVNRAPCPAIEHGLAFLNARYNPTLGLLNESANYFPHRYWLTTDNTLAAFVVGQFGYTDLSVTIRTSIRQYGDDSNGLIEVLWGIPVVYPPHIANQSKLTNVGEDEIWQEMRIDGEPMQDWAEYADLSFWGALNAYQQGHAAEALNIFAGGMALYDGKGFADKAFNNPPPGEPARYDTYKLALALYVGGVIQAPLSNSNELHATLLAMQNPQGGFITNYTDFVIVRIILHIEP